jgi:hypothetical protein
VLWKKVTTGQLVTNIYSFLTVPEFEKLKMKMLSDLVSSEGLFSSSQMATVGCIISW